MLAVLGCVGVDCAFSCSRRVRGILVWLCFEVIGFGWEAAFFDSCDEFCGWPKAAERGVDLVGAVAFGLLLLAVFAAGAR